MKDMYRGEYGFINVYIKRIAETSIRLAKVIIRRTNETVTVIVTGGGIKGEP
ncbi:hypothetical protein GCM10008022_06680 [Paenibacillus hunanensis]|nr:hypothetical protein GCM10008022_06680 [Paenibacillus hunanensis]